LSLVTVLESCSRAWKRMSALDLIFYFTHVQLRASSLP
jgi:hypothetical protein